MFYDEVAFEAEERYEEMLREAERERLARRVRPAHGLARVLVALGLA